jgi:hypothetical protein
MGHTLAVMETRMKALHDGIEVSHLLINNAFCK